MNRKILLFGVLALLTASCFFGANYGSVFTNTMGEYLPE